MVTDVHSVSWRCQSVREDEVLKGVSHSSENLALTQGLGWPVVGKFWASRETQGKMKMCVLLTSRRWQRALATMWRHFCAPGTEPHLGAWIFSSNSYNILRGKTFLSPHYGWRNWGMGPLSGLPKVTQLESGGQSGISHQFCLHSSASVKRFPLQPSHPMFLRLNWGGGKNEPRDTLGKQTPAEGQEPPLVCPWGCSLPQMQDNYVLTGTKILPV